MEKCLDCDSEIEAADQPCSVCEAFHRAKARFLREEKKEEYEKKQESMWVFFTLATRPCAERTPIVTRFDAVESEARAMTEIRRAFLALVRVEEERALLPLSWAEFTKEAAITDTVFKAQLLNMKDGELSFSYGQELYQELMKLCPEWFVKE